MARHFWKRRGKEIVDRPCFPTGYSREGFPFGITLIGSADLVVISDKTDVIKILAKVIPRPLGLLFFEILRRLPTVT